MPQLLQSLSPWLPDPCTHLSPPAGMGKGLLRKGSQVRGSFALAIGMNAYQLRNFGGGGDSLAPVPEQGPLKMISLDRRVLGQEGPSM